MLDKTFDPKSIEAKLYQKWESSGAFTCEPASSKKPYCIMMPPPNVTGSLHIGHALNHSLQDILVRYHRMKGEDVLWQPGTDHAGIATQMVVERQMDQEGLKRHDIGREKFVERVWTWKAESGGTIVNQLRHLGASPDWARERFTMDEGLNKAVIKVFVELYQQGLIYRDKRLVNWDPKLQTALSDLEVLSTPQEGFMWHINYKIEGSDRTITIATTRPETMLGDTAIVVHPDDERYQDLIGKNAVLPLVGRVIPIIADTYADPELGTGALKCTPAHDFNDFEIGKRHNLKFINIFDERAHLNENTPAIYQGMERFAARKKIVEDLTEQGFLDKIVPHQLSVPLGDRSGVVVEPWMMDQWYCDAKTLAGPALQAVEEGKTKFHPKSWENTYFDWLRNIQPWCISRQLWWGHQIPAWYGPDKHIFVAMSEDEAEAQAFKHYGKQVELVREEDVLDTWFSSALWPFSTLGWPDKTVELDRYYPTSTLVTGFDIIFFWVARMMMMGLHFMKEVPFKDVYIHALVRDEKGQKMSKSKGNVIDPLKLIDSYGCDAVRFTLAALAAQGRDIALGEDRVEGYRNFGTKLWNAARYCEMNQCQLTPGFKPDGVKHEVNRWLISELVSLNKAVTIAFDQYRFNEAASALYQFIWGTFCDWYLEFTKPILNGEDLQAKSETQSTTAWVLQQLLVLLHPLMPYLTEELAAQLNLSQGLLIKASWPTLSETFIDQKAVVEMNWIIEFVSQLRALRVEMGISPALPLKLFVKEASHQIKTRLESQDLIIKRLGRIAEIKFDDHAKGIEMVMKDAVFTVPMEGLIDVAKEKQRLQKESQKLKIEIDAITQKLSNPGFVDKAPAHVIDLQHQRRNEAQIAFEKLDQALGRLDLLN